MSDFGVALLCGQLWNRSNDDTYYNRKIAGAAACNGHIHRSGPLLCFGFWSFDTDNGGGGNGGTLVIFIGERDNFHLDGSECSPDQKLLLQKAYAIMYNC